MMTKLQTGQNKFSGAKYEDSFKYGRVRLLRRADSGIWYVRYPRPNDAKRYRERSLGTERMKDAKLQADHINSQLTNGVLDIVDDTAPIATIVRRFLKAKRGRVKMKTLQRLQTTITSFMIWLSEHQPNIELAKHLNPQIIRSFQEHRLYEGLEPRTINGDIQNLHTMFLWAVREKLIKESPADYSRNGNIDRYKVLKKKQDVYSEEEVKGLIREAARRHDQLTSDLITVFSGTGLRFQELAHLTARFLDWDSAIPEIEITAHGGWSPKDPDETKRIPMLPEVEEVLRRRSRGCAPDDYVFKNSVGNRVKVERSRARLKRLFPSVGINTEERKLHWHSFRNYFIVRCLKNSVAVNAIMEWTGHDSAKMVLHYAKSILKQDSHKEFRKIM